MHEETERIAGDAFSIALPGKLDNRIFDADGNTAGRIEKLLIDVNNGLIRYTEVKLLEHGSVRLPWATLLAKKSGGYTLSPIGKALIDSARSRKQSKSKS
ncbi:MAG: hypothetical protein KJP25_09140 [Gammaproteobacteria bacterium]|nr:hypothetical protein [Gammaproteobacteria bacterium]MBT8150064.1 hypothetical protein [Gammaproteobacteria bacterium]NND39905.1 hypothetical protein [Pseudomonadales bacterium]NNM12445.1 hypothetical protein [Pseudomonadales bacterium]RZV49245.1 MAG: hypothetical protein EX270_12975 [Pseudomonadales bacterium]